MKLKISALVIVLLSLVCLGTIGCGGGSAQASSSKSSPAVSSTSSTATTTTDPAAAANTAAATTAAAAVNSAGSMPTAATTLAAAVGNNTNQTTFNGTANGNVKPGNISKMPMRNLLYAGANTKIYVHYMPWWNSAGHVSIGLGEEDNPAVVNAQVADAASRGFEGFMIDWYGPQNTHNDIATQNVMHAAEATTDFEFAIIEDSGSLTGAANVTQKLLADIQYMSTTYFTSPAYMRKDGRPVVGFFLSTTLAIDWATVRAQAAGNPLFIFENAGAFTQADSDGGFSWIGISGNPADMDLAYLDGFYQAGLANPTKHTFGSPHKGFNDTLASWSANRIVNQSCGQTWLATWAETNKFYSAGNQLENIQVPTWNDYEEGTEIESGIDNCVTISATLAAQTLSWSISGLENTLDHYTVYVSADGQNLTPLTEVAAGNHSINLSGYALAPGTYSVFVEAVGQPGLLNHMSAAVPMTL